MTTILVTFASKHGATAEIAHTIARYMKTFDLDVTTRRVEHVDDLTGYDAIVLGTAIYLGEWVSEAFNFLETYQAQLKQKSVWIFVSGPTGEGDALDLLDGVLVPESARPLLDHIAPKGIQVFKGKIDLRRLPEEHRKIIKAAEVPRGDYRDWDAIHQWADQISVALTQTDIIIKPETALLPNED
ncbi:MAG: flavodoxin domain-containing protein [Anaerolineae bacterium]